MKVRLLLGLCAMLVLTVGLATATAGNGEKNPCKNGGWQTVYGSDGTTFKNEDKCIDYLRAGGKVSTAFLVITRDIYPCGGTCWGFVSGKGLAPNAAVNLNTGTGFADANGNFAGPLNLSCGSNWTGIVATSTTASGKPITSNTVNTPCG